MFVMENGVDYPLGARLDEAGCHFCVWAPQSDKVELCLFDEQEQELSDSDGHIPNCGGDLRVEFRRDPENSVVIFSGESFYYRRAA